MIRLFVGRRRRGKFSGGKSGDACDVSSWGSVVNGVGGDLAAAIDYLRFLETQRWDGRKKIVGAFEFRGGRKMGCLDLRRKREAVVTWCPRNTCILDGEDGNTCPSSRDAGMRGGEVNRVKG